MMVDPLVLSLVVVLCIAIGVIIYLFFRSTSNEGGMKDDLFTLMQRDQLVRQQENQALRQELQNTTKSMREEFFQVNQTVDVKLSESSKELNKRFEKSSAVIGDLQKELGKMGEIGSKIESLDRILRAPKGRGAMGEENLEEILRSVFPPNLWERQYNLGSGMVVDAVIKTSNGILPIDAKFPLPSFERLVASSDKEAQDAGRKAFEKDVKKRIDEVSKYVSPENNTLNFAILFLPNENIYYEAAIRSGVLKEYGDTKKVLLTGPNTMIYVLQMLFQAYQSQEFASQAKEALAQLNGIKQQSLKLEEGLEVLEKHIRNANTKVGDVKTDHLKLSQQIDQTVKLEGIE